ncbi:MAG: peptidyl-prolyl cis-trans isomerase [Candidatus Eisenbacteria bacterium]|nr:peptidyl-prolyl cis-trans isomerase [Candidatus Eisenbacteria bacterium]
MLKQMRENTKIVLWIVIAAFVGLIFAVWGMDLQSPQKGAQSGVIGKVNGRKLSARLYQQVFTEEMNAFRGESDIPVLPAVSRLLEERAWDRLVNQAILDERLEKENYQVSDEEIVYAIRTNPPEFLRRADAFLTDGRFDYQKYREAIDDPTMDWRGLEQYFREQLPMEHLRARVAAAARVTEGELRDLYVRSSETVDFSFVAFLPGEYEDREPKIDDGALRAWYDEHKSEYRMPERAELAYVALEVVPTESDREFLRRRMEEVLERHREGTPFEDLARYYSEGPTAKQGGDIGSFSRGQMTPELEEQAFGLEVGGVSDVIPGEAGYQIVQLVERTGSGRNEEVHLRQIFLNLEAGGETLESIRTTAQALYDEAKDTGIAEAASKRDLPVERTGLFQEGTVVPGIGVFQAGNVFAFMGEPGDVSEPLFHDETYYVLELARRDSSRVPDFEEARDLVVQSVKRNERLKIAREEASRYAGDPGRGATLETIARRAGREVREASLISRAGSVPGVGADLKLILAAFAGPAGETIGPVDTESGSFYLKQKEIHPVDEERYQAERPMLLHSLLAQRQEAVFNDWLAKQREQAKVEDFRPKEESDQG